MIRVQRRMSKLDVELEKPLYMRRGLGPSILALEDLSQRLDALAFRRSLSEFDRDTKRFSYVSLGLLLVIPELLAFQDQE